MKEINANLSDAAKQRLSDTVAGMYNALKKENPNKEVSFEDLVKALIDRKSKSLADEHFNATAKGWQFAKLPGYENVDFKGIYNRLFPSLVNFENFEHNIEPIYEDKNIKVRYDEELVGKSSKLQIEPAQKKDVKSGSNTWLYTKEGKVRISSYFIFPASFGLFFGWYYKQSFSFNWIAFFLASLTLLSFCFLVDKKYRKYLGSIHRDLKIVITTILALIIIAILVGAIGYMQYIAEKLSIDESDVMGLSFYVYYIAFLIYALWESND